jgi:hypothetical protein
MAAKTRNELTLEDKVKLIKYLEAGNSERKAAEAFKVSKGSVSNIKQRKEEYLSQYEDDNMPKDRCRKMKKTENEDVNELVWTWFKKARSMNIPLSGPLVQEAAKSFAEKLGKETFQASKGWLESFRNRHQIEFRSLHGESESADPSSASEFLSRLGEICDGYRPEDIFNADETALYFKAPPQKSLVEKYKKAKGQKYSKERLTVLLATSATGEKLKPFVIGKSEKPRCFKNIRSENLPVTWRANSKAWMRLNLFEEWLYLLNNSLMSKRRKIILFIDNCEAHSDIKLSNIKVKYLPANTTSLIQPLDQGIIQCFKTLYRKNLVRHLITQVEAGGSDSGSIIEDITVLDAVHWISRAWNDVSSQCIQNCFRKAGFSSLPANNQLVDEAPILGRDFVVAQDLNIFPREMSSEEFCSFDDDIAISSEIVESSMLVDRVLHEHQERQGVMIEEEKADTESEEEKIEDIEEPYCPSYSEVLIMIKHMKTFATIQEETLLHEVTKLEGKFNDIQAQKASNKRQATLDQYFNV